MTTLVPGLENWARSMKGDDGSPLFQETDQDRLKPGMGVLGRLCKALDGYRIGAQPVSIPLENLDEANLSLIRGALREGEVAITITGPEPAEIQETVISGVWFVRQHEGLPHLEVGAFPSLALKALESATRNQPPPIESPEGAMNVGPILTEIGARMMETAPGSEAHVINLSRLPMNPIDMEVLEGVLGTGPVSVLSRGYGDCRIASTVLRGVWRIRYFNVDGTLIMVTVEIVDVPDSVRAHRQDLEDGCRRLRGILAAYD